ncbi:MAG: tetratricopeptide repeat protein, partial [Acidobacteriota bacterium]
MKARSLLLLCVLNSAALVAEPSLEPDRTRRYVVAAGQTVRLELAAAPHDSFILLEVDQLDTDVLLRVTPESESETLLADQPLGFREPERLVLPPGPGYRVEIKARRRGAVGVRWRLADPDSARWPGDQAWSRATHAFAADTPESRLEAADAFEQAAALYEQAGLERDAARALACAGHVAADLGEGERGLGLLRRAIDRRRQSGPPHALAEAHHLLANALQRGRRLDASLSAFERSLEIFRELGDEPAEARALLNIGFISQLQGDAAAARSRYEVALAMARAHDDRSVIAKLLNNLGGLDYRAGDLGSAVRRLESLLVFQPEDDLRGRSRTLGNLASAQRLLGRYQESLDGFERALEIQETLGDPRIRAATLNNLGFTYLKLGETARARAYFERALPLRRRAEDPRGEA